MSNNEIKYKFIDLFCGIGGFHQALSKIGCECVFACDIDEKCREIYKKNYDMEPFGDINEINIKKIPKFDILCGGFPCQPFSKAGFQKGFDDNRGNLFFSMCKIIKYHKPKYLILENVRNLASHDEGKTLQIIYNKIDELGYYTYINPLILNVLHFNIPQNRERVVILCKRKDLGELPECPNIQKNPKKKLTKTIKDYIDDIDDDDEIYQLNDKMKDVEKIWNNFIKILIKNNIDIPKFPIWTDWWYNELDLENIFYKKYTNWINKNRIFYKDNKKYLKKWLENARSCDNWNGSVRKFEWQAGDLKEDDSMNTIMWTARGSGIRCKRLDYVPTLVAMNMIPVYGPKSRKLTIRELLKLQSFPTSFKYNKKTIFKQLGNAVNVTMIKKCANFLLFNKPLFNH